MKTDKNARTLFPELVNFAEQLLDRNVEEGRGEKAAIYFRDQAFTYSQLQKLANKVGNYLKSIDLRREERVAIILHDSPYFAASLLGIIKIGAVAVPISTLLNINDYEFILNDCRARALIVSKSIFPVIEKIRPRLQHLHDIIAVSDSDDEEIGFGESVSAMPDLLKPVQTSSNEPALWQYTSGTTGKPKGVVHLHHDMLYCAELYGNGILRLTPEDCAISISKLSYGFGLGNSLYCPFWAGASTVLYTERPTHEKVVSLVNKHKPTLFSGVPTFYAALLENPEWLNKADWDPVRIFYSAGESLFKKTFLSWKEKTGKEIIEGLGATEVGHIFISNKRDDVKLGSVGKVVPGYEVKIVDESLQEVPVGEMGRVMVKGESVAAYYWNRHDDTKKTFIGEWLLTGDMMYRDSAGYYFFVGRANDMMKPGGFWVSPAEVEEVLLQHSAVFECAVTEAADKDGLAKPKAFVVLTQGCIESEELAAELKQFVKDRLARYKYPRWVQFVSDLPKSPTGKIQRFRLRDLG